MSKNYRLDLPGNEDINITIDYNRKLWSTAHPGWLRIANQWGGVIEVVFAPRESEETIEVNGVPTKLKNPYVSSVIYCYNGTATIAQAEILNAPAFPKPPGAPVITPQPSRIERNLAAFVLRYDTSFSGYFRFIARPFNPIDFRIRDNGKWQIVP